MTEEPAICAEVLLDLPARRADRRLTYRIPAALRGDVCVGSRVSVPLGSRTARGFVIAVAPGDGPSGVQVREIFAAATPPLFSPRMLELAQQIAEHTLSTLLEAVHCLAPAEVFRRRTPLEPDAFASLAPNGAAPARLGRRQAQIIDALAARGQVPVSELRRRGGGPTLRRLVALGAVAVTTRRPPRGGGGPASRPAASDTYVWGGAAARRAWIVEAARAAVAQGGRALVIVPEIAMVEAFAGCFAPIFGTSLVMLHSGMRGRERQAAWARCAAQQADVILGTRSAAFAPVQGVRLIAVDDEHDAAHHSAAAPRYHAREAARRRAALDGASLVLASATPSVEAYAEIAGGRMRCVRLAADAPERVTLVDMRAERAQGRFGLLASPLVAAIRRHLRAAGRIALFVNRTGYARVLLCDECGTVVRCPRCAVAMRYDRDGRHVGCRICAFLAPAPGTCPRCGGVALRGVGPGTERVEEIVRRVFPALRIARLDRETAPMFDSIASDFAAGRVRLIVGTQMLLRARRIHPSLVGVLDADLPLHRPDFRGAERTFQQLRAVCALAAGTPGSEAVVQTRVPEHPALRALATGDDEAVYRGELEMRRELGYPPFAQLARIVASCPAKEEAAALAARVVAAARRSGVEALGPAPGRDSAAAYRYQCLLRAAEAGAVRAAARAALASAPRGAGRLTVEMDPQEFD